MVFMILSCLPPHLLLNVVRQSYCNTYTLNMSGTQREFRRLTNSTLSLFPFNIELFPPPHQSTSFDLHNSPIIACETSIPSCYECLDFFFHRSPGWYGNHDKLLLRLKMSHFRVNSGPLWFLPFMYIGLC